MVQLVKLKKEISENTKIEHAQQSVFLYNNLKKCALTLSPSSSHHGIKETQPA